MNILFVSPTHNDHKVDHGVTVSATPSVDVQPAVVDSGDFSIPNEVAQLVRGEFVLNFERIIREIDAASGEIPDNLWIEIPEQEKFAYQVVMQQARIALHEHGYYDGKILTLQQRVRCHFNPEHSECANPVE